MATDTEKQYHVLIAKANRYHTKALWQEKLRVLQEALAICLEDGFPEAEQRKQQVLFEIGGIRRRFGQYDEGVDVLQQALLTNEHGNPLMRARVLGELGVVYRHSNKFAQAQKTFKEQYQIVHSLAIEAEAELCRAVGNEGTSTYQLSQQGTPQDERLLQLAFEQLRERIERAEKLHNRLLSDDPGSKYVQLSMAWKTIGMDRLTLCHIAVGDTVEAVRLAEETQRAQVGDDPTIKAFSRFFYGNALWNNGQRDQAIEQWTAPPGTCASAMALCKEPSAEHAQYLELLAKAGVDFNSFDEQGFSPLDYAVLTDNPDAMRMAQIITDAFRPVLRKQFEGYVPKLSEDEVTRRIDEEIEARLQQAKLRRYYRAILQEHIRPELRYRGYDSVQNLRKTYAELLANNESMQSLLDCFYYVPYKDFKNIGRLPLSDDRPPGSKETVVRKFSSPSLEDDESSDLFIIFFSYRWIGKTSDPPLEGPDDASDTQYHRMLSAIEGFLTMNRHVNPEKLGLWLDCACVNQRQPEQRARGVHALPLAITQCNTMISLVDEDYYDRAWCAVEVMLIRELIQSYHLHDWSEHLLHSPKTDRLAGVLKPGRLRLQFDIGNLQLTQEALDRPKIDFLLRQSKLLGRDDA